MTSAFQESLKRFALAMQRASGPRPDPSVAKRRRPRRDGDAASPAPVDPTRPGSLDGGATAALTFDD